jgi:hypothetical protein
VARGGLLSPANRPKDLGSEREDVSSEPEQTTLGSMNVRDARTNPPELAGRSVRRRGDSDDLRYGPTSLIINIDPQRSENYDRCDYRPAG